MYKLSVTNDAGKTLDLTPSGKFTVTSISGLLPPSADINNSTAGNADGAVFNGARLQPRNIVITILPNFPVEKNRLSLYEVFRVKKPVTVHYKNASRDIQIEGYVESVIGELFVQSQTIQVSILCLDPYLKSAAEIVDDLSAIIDMFEFPFSTEDEGIVFSEIAQTNSVIITNSGEAEAGLIIKLRTTGTVKNPIIYDATNVTGFGLNFTMLASDEITIDTRRGKKSVILLRDGETYNLINMIKDNPTWFSVAPGETVFTYSADTNLNFLYVKFFHYDLYEGV